MTAREKLLTDLLIEWLRHRINEYGGVSPGYDPSFVSRTVEAVGMPDGMIEVSE